jgi:hypothetical protein
MKIRIKREAERKNEYVRNNGREKERERERERENLERDEARIDGKKKRKWGNSGWPNG